MNCRSHAAFCSSHARSSSSTCTLCFALLFERAGLIPALIVLILIASLANEEFKLVEVIGNMVALSVLCTLVFKLGLGMNISILRGVW